MFYLTLYIISLILGGIVNYLFPGNSIYYNFALVQLVFTVGLFGIINFVAHVISRKKIAKTIGWESNGFQIELGIVSLGMGICGLLSFFFRDGFWLATTIPYSVFLFGAAIHHIYETIKFKNYNPGNTIIIIPDILMPLTLLICLFNL